MTYGANHPVIGGVYVHYKTLREFVVRDIGLLHDGMKRAVVYKETNGQGDLWIRTVESWIELVEGVPRFTRIS